MIQSITKLALYPIPEARIDIFIAFKVYARCTPAIAMRLTITNTWLLFLAQG